MTVPRLEDLRDLDGGLVLVRLDLNVPLHDGDVVTFLPRVEGG